MVMIPSQEYRAYSRDWLWIALDTVKAFRGADHPEGWGIWRDLCQEIKWTRYQEALWWHHHNASSALCTAQLPDPILPQMKMCFLSPNYLTMPGIERSICWAGCGHKAKSPFHPHIQQSLPYGGFFSSLKSSWFQLDTHLSVAEEEGSRWCDKSPESLVLCFVNRVVCRKGARVHRADWRIGTAAQLRKRTPGGGVFSLLLLCFREGGGRDTVVVRSPPERPVIIKETSAPSFKWGHKRC